MNTLKELPLAAILLFGSHARGDAGPNSDTDLFGISRGGKLAAYDANCINLTVSNTEVVLKKAKAGDLFISHIAFEAMPLFDPNGLLLEIKREFQWKSNYDPLIRDACRLAYWIIDTNEKMGTFNEGARWLSWCARTAAIGTLANNKKPVFATPQLVSFLGIPSLSLIINNKNSPLIDRSISNSAKIFFRRFFPIDSEIKVENASDLLSKLEDSDSIEIFRKIARSQLEINEYSSIEDKFQQY